MAPSQNVEIENATKFGVFRFSVATKLIDLDEIWHGMSTLPTRYQQGVAPTRRNVLARRAV